MRRWVYDIEVYKNLFLLVAVNTETKEYIDFEISTRKDKREDLYEWLTEHIDEMVGFNNVSYDYPVLEHLMLHLIEEPSQSLCIKLKSFSDSLIAGKVFKRKEQPFLKQIDLFLINNYNNKARMTSLKLLEFNLNMPNIQELPYAHDAELSLQQIQDVVDYCYNDVDTTLAFYETCKDEIHLREVMSKKLNHDLTNYSGVKMGEYIFEDKLIQSLGKEAVYEQIETNEGTKSVLKQTPREKIHLKDCIVPYVQFSTKPLINLLMWFKSKTIEDTNGVFTNIPFEQMRSLEGHYQLEKTTIAHPDYPNDRKKRIPVQATLNVVIQNVPVYWGVGGLHGSIESGVYTSDDEWVIYSQDVTSFYPNLSIKNNLKPEHLGDDFCTIYNSIFEERRLYKKGTAENLALKLSLNSVYGRSGSEFSMMYDKQFTMSITISGQMSLMMLIERTLLDVPDTKLLMINTDGFEVMCRRTDLEKIKNISKMWEAYTKLELEDAYYDKMIINNVNNYIAVTDTGKIKRKGAMFIYKKAPGELEYHKDFSALIIPKALEAYFVYGKDPEDFIRNHTDIHDFFKRTKVDKNSKVKGYTYDKDNLLNGVEEYQRISRYLVTGKRTKVLRKKEWIHEGVGVSLFKEMPPLKNKSTEERNTFYEKGYLCTVMNNLSDWTEEQIRSMIYYPYYIDKVKETIKNIVNERATETDRSYES